MTQQLQRTLKKLPLPFRSAETLQSIVATQLWLQSQPLSFLGVSIGQSLFTIRDQTLRLVARFLRSSSSVIPTSTIIKNTFLTHHSIISQC
ncbi:hypothetical protein CDV31_012922 [Fusarium ambrosium]|uniref:Uncharacterized protein n=1 Tax=Fusarium ambrosium TaxID=131363 RepID=A0A428T6K2_9HYPO|nr:hypothetical protein CDV31_012922 [Fusarium ambrosium]